MHSMWSNDGCIASRVLVLLHLYSRHILPDSFLVCGNKRRGARSYCIIRMQNNYEWHSAYAAKFYVNPKSRAGVARLKPAPSRRDVLFSQNASLIS